MRQLKRCDRCLEYYKGIRKFKTKFYCYNCYRYELTLNRILNHFIDNPNKIFVVSEFRYESGKKYLNELIGRDLIEKVITYFINCPRTTTGYRLNKQKSRNLIELRQISQSI